MHIDVLGHPLYRKRFAAVEPFYNGQARVERFDGGLEVIDETGATVVELRPALKSEFAALSDDLTGFWRTQAICTAVELGVFEALPATAARDRAAPAGWSRTGRGGFCARLPSYAWWRSAMACGGRPVAAPFWPPVTRGRLPMRRSNMGAVSRGCGRRCPRRYGEMRAGGLRTYSGRLPPTRAARPLTTGCWQATPCTTTTRFPMLSIFAAMSG